MAGFEIIVALLVLALCFTALQFGSSPPRRHRSDAVTPEEKYRRYAHEAQEQAQRSRTAADKASWLRIAQSSYLAPGVFELPKTAN